MRADDIRRGIVTLCIGGGQGIALGLEALARSAFGRLATGARWSVKAE